MKSPKREVYIRKVLDTWKMEEEFTAEQFAFRYNNTYGHYSIPASGFFVYFLRFQKEGIMEIIKSEERRQHRYKRVEKPVMEVSQNEMGN